jgi:hypothetical protein
MMRLNIHPTGKLFKKKMLHGRRSMPDFYEHRRNLIDNGISRYRNDAGQPLITAKHWM